MSAADLAAAHGLSPSGRRPGLPEYGRRLWARRHFIHELARARHHAQYTRAKLGQLWQVVTPLLNAAVYYLVFGLLMDTRRGVPDYIPFLVTGVFVFTFTQSSVLAGVRAVSGSIGLVRALHFPRASLPIALTLVQLRQLLWSLAVLVAILLGVGETPSARWLLVLPALLCQALFNTGTALVFARLGARTPDLAQLMPFVLRTWMYASGVMYSIQDRAKDAPAAVRAALDLNPAAVYIDLVRHGFIDSFGSADLPPHVWAVALGWALVAFAGGFVYFWQAEESYGRG